MDIFRIFKLQQATLIVDRHGIIGAEKALLLTRLSKGLIDLLVMIVMLWIGFLLSLRTNTKRDTEVYRTAALFTH